MATNSTGRDNNDVKEINVGRDFSPYPSGRYRTDGKFSGEVFREECLLPALKRAGKLKIDLDSAMGYGSSFLEEAFGGLVRVDHFDPKELKRKIQFLTKRKSVEKEIWGYIQSKR